MGKITNEYLAEVIDIIAREEERESNFCKYRIQRMQNSIIDNKLKKQADYHFVRHMRAKFVSEWLKSGGFPSDSENISYEFYEEEYFSSVLYRESFCLDLLSLIEDKMMVEWAQTREIVRKPLRNYYHFYK